jgi:hypothetical protein
MTGRDPDYLTSIEAKLARQPDVVHYRVLFGPPRRRVLKEHLAHLLQVRNPESRQGGNKTIFIGLFEDLAKEPENGVCANENRAFVRLPSMNGMQKHDTGIEFRGPAHASRYVRLVQELDDVGRPASLGNVACRLGSSPARCRTTLWMSINEPETTLNVNPRRHST